MIYIIYITFWEISAQVIIIIPHFNNIETFISIFIQEICKPVYFTVLGIFNNVFTYVLNIFLGEYHNSVSEMSL